MGTAGSRSSTRVDLATRLGAALAARFDCGARIAVALSGGRDSMALLDALARARQRVPIALSACHVHHGLHPAADRWAAFCAAACAERDIPLAIVRLRLQRTGGESLEACARAARHAALRRLEVDAVALAHHADDQVETVILQLLRGSGPRGLAGMPACSSGRPAFWRPLLDLPRTAIEAYCAWRGLDWVDDDSNADPSLRRNFVRTRIAPLLPQLNPRYRETIARAAAHQGAAARLLSDLAELDAGGAALDRVPLAALNALSEERAANLLREVVARQGVRPPSAARLRAWLAQLRGRAGGALELRHEGLVIGVSRGRLHIRPPQPRRFRFDWDGSERIDLPHGTLTFASRQGAGVARRALSGRRIEIRSRAGGERLRLRTEGPTHMLKTLLHSRAMPTWERDALPLIFADGMLVAVPGVGVAVACAAGPDEEGLAVEWTPCSARPAPEGQAV